MLSAGLNKKLKEIKRKKFNSPPPPPFEAAAVSTYLGCFWRHNACSISKFWLFLSLPLHISQVKKDEDKGTESEEVCLMQAIR